MTDIKEKALALVNEVRREYPNAADYTAGYMALCRAIEQHEAFKQEVSDAAEQYNEAGAPMGWEGFDRFITPKPQPDPLVEVLDAMKDGRAGPTTESYAACLRAALEARGLEIREKGR
jgi:hypothetical protein